MSDYIPPFELTNKIVKYISEISEITERLVIKNNLILNPRLRKDKELKVQSLQRQGIWQDLMAFYKWTKNAIKVISTRFDIRADGREGKERGGRKKRR